MKTFEEVWAFTNNIRGDFTRLSAEKLYAAGLSVPKHGTIAEIGVSYGRSLSVLLQSAIQADALFVLVDTWENGAENLASVKELLRTLQPNCMLLEMKSTAAAKIFVEPLDLIHIDAYHFDNIPDAGPSMDCELWLPKVKSGGLACFHDYDSCFPDVNIAVDKFTAGWENLGAWDGLAIRRKP